MKKPILLACISFLSSIPQLQSISLEEYIQQQGMQWQWYEFFHYISVANKEVVSLKLIGKNLTDLTGLQSIPNIHLVTHLDLSYNRLQTLPDTIFNNLPNLRVLSLSDISPS